MRVTESGTTCQLCQVLKRKNKMFGLLQKMDNFSNDQMDEDQKIDFMQEIVDNGMVWDMHEKYLDQAEKYLNAGKCFFTTFPGQVELKG